MSLPDRSRSKWEHKGRPAHPNLIKRRSPLSGLPVYYRMRRGWRSSDFCTRCDLCLYECSCPLDRRPWMYQPWKHYPARLRQRTHTAQHTDYSELNKFGGGLLGWWAGLCLLACGFLPEALLIPYLVGSLVVTVLCVASSFVGSSRDPPDRYFR